MSVQAHCYVGDMRSDLFPAGPLQQWAERQKIRLAANGSDWHTWCTSHGISEWSRKKVNRGGSISYNLIDMFLTPAGMQPEDLYGWPDG